MLRTLELTGTDPRRWGEQHGESFRDDVRALYGVRLELMLEKTDLGSEKNVLALAEHHLETLRSFDTALAAELAGIAAGAGLSEAHIVVVNHYTDLRDLRLADLRALDPGGCSAIVAETSAGRVLAQTWDMHASATPFALLMIVPQLPDNTGPSKLSGAGIPQLGKTAVFSVTGCLGMTGMSSWGVGLTINNLNSVDATIGVVWPAMVRKALRQPTALAAKDLIMNGQVGSGRHYIVADTDDVVAIETSGTKKKIIGHNASMPYFHTNHCIDPEMVQTNRILPGSTTVARYETLTRTIPGSSFADERAVFDAFAPVNLTPKPGQPHDVATCGAIAMNLTTGNLVAVQGHAHADSDALVVELRQR
jgi:isopenicillin-N N-acyltransferase like protein